jgi:hypothetical protein
MIPPRAHHVAARGLEEPQLREEVIRLLPRAANAWSPQTMDRAELLAVALVRNPQLAVAHAQVQAALAQEIGVAQSPNSDLTLQSEYGAHRDPHPWVYGLSLNWLLRSPERRRLELQIARLETRGARLQLMDQAWAVRRSLAAALSDSQAADVLKTVNAAYHGSVAGELNESDRSVPVLVRITGAGADPAAIGAPLIRGRDGALVTLSTVPKIEMVLARSLIDHEDGLRRQIVVASPKSVDQAGYAKSARKAIAAQVELPPGVYLHYGGAAAAHTAAANELLSHSIAAFVLIALMLSLAFAQARHVLIVLLALPSTLIGGVAAVALTGGTLTLGAMVGLVALFGMAARNTILLVSHYDHLVREEGQSWNLATALRGAEVRLTPVLLTSLLTGLALLPVALQLRQPGHEIEGPMAVVILGGLVSSTLVSLLLIPPLSARWLRPSRG